MKKNKIIWILLLIVFLIVVIALGINVNKKDENKNETNTQVSSARTSNIDKNTVNEDISSNNETTDYIKKQLNDGVLYSKNGEEYKADIVVGDNYFDTTINDMYLNSETYKNKKIEVEGFYLSNSPYTFVGRYSTSNMCAYCPTGYSYIEYALDGKIDRNFTDEEDWIKIIGTLEVGNDADSNYEDFYYLKVLSLEVMNERGNDTVNN